MKKILAQLILLFCVAVPALGYVAQPPVTPPAMRGGYIPTSDDWNTAIVGVYNYINSTIVAPLNTLTAKGDFYVFTGSALEAQPVGANNTILIADHTQQSGMAWGTTTGQQALNTKGDLEVFDGTLLQALPVGTDGYALVSRITSPNGVVWESLANGNAFPTGSIIAWSPNFAGGSVPAGWSVCDGTNGTPNLIGRLTLGTRPNGSSASPSPGGYGAEAVDKNGFGATAHPQSFSLNVTDGNGGTNKTAIEDAGSDTTAASGSAISVCGPHAHSLQSLVAAAGGNNEQPSDYGLVYLVKN